MVLFFALRRRLLAFRRAPILALVLILVLLVFWSSPPLRLWQLPSSDPSSSVVYSLADSINRESSNRLSVSLSGEHLEETQTLPQIFSSMHSHHSHSGDYILHAKDHLDDVVAQAIKMGFKTYCLTEHMPRNNLQDLYPEESALKVADLESNFAKFYAHARRLQAKYADQITLLVGFETDYIRPDFKSLVSTLQSNYKFDMFVGSVHHVNTVPIDFDKAAWNRAMISAGGTPRDIFSAYFDEQYAMLTDLQPPVVGHFDLIRLFAEQYTDTPINPQWPDVWAKIVRNIEFIVSYGGLIELNSAAIRKGWDCPYPRPDIVALILEKGGNFCFSDDSHAIAQVGLNFHKVLQYIEKIGINEVYYFDLDKSGNTVLRKDEVARLKTDPFWAQYETL
ncbi:polymerase/histidinol phosphatase-like protein [Limtongia smithiae]|uniref:polymerase/histidinol phosphatase-like protein n=1 Tax=Limtongia smithiae TaxID=1125753 RepID=UPI0034CD455A